MKEMKTVYPYIPNSAPENKEKMMEELGITDLDELYKDIPKHLRFQRKLDIPDPILDEYSMKKHMDHMLGKNIHTEEYSCFLGAGCQKHYTPAVCDEIVGRGEFLTAYSGATTCDRGKWQAVWEYQAQMSELLDVDFIGFPQYDGGWALSHAVRMSIRMTGRRKILVSAGINPSNLAILMNYTDGIHSRQAEIIPVSCDTCSGVMDREDLKSKLDDDVAAVVVENPTFLGEVDLDAEQIGEMARKAGAEFIVYTDPFTLGVLEPPVNYGATMTVGDIHSLGGHLSAGGCQGGFIGLPAAERYLNNYKDIAVSISPTVKGGEYDFVYWNLEHSSYGMREDANEFTGTACNLWAINTAVYLASMGPQGMLEIDELNLRRAQYAAEQLSKIPGIKIKSQNFFNEFVVDFHGTGKSVAQINRHLLEHKIIGGLDLGSYNKKLESCALYCVTECISQEETDHLVSVLKKFVA